MLYRMLTLIEIKKKSHFWCFIELQSTLGVQIWEFDGDWGVRTHQEKNENFIN